MGGTSRSIGRLPEDTDRPDRERGIWAPYEWRSGSDRLCTDRAGSWVCDRPPDGTLCRRLAPRGGRAAPVALFARCGGPLTGNETGGNGADGEGPLDQLTVSPGSSDILLICESRAFPLRGIGGEDGSASDARGETLGEEAAEKGDGYRSGAKPDSADRPSSEEGDRVSVSGEIMPVLRRDTAVRFCRSDGPGSLFAAKSMHSCTSLMIWSLAISDSACSVSVSLRMISTFRTFADRQLLLVLDSPVTHLGPPRIPSDACPPAEDNSATFRASDLHVPLVQVDLAPPAAPLSPCRALPSSLPPETSLKG